LSDTPLIKGGYPRLSAPPLLRGAGGIEPKIYLQFNYNQLLKQQLFLLLEKAIKPHKRPQTCYRRTDRSPKRKKWRRGLASWQILLNFWE